MSKKVELTLKKLVTCQSTSMSIDLRMLKNQTTSKSPPENTHGPKIKAACVSSSLRPRMFRGRTEELLGGFFGRSVYHSSVLSFQRSTAAILGVSKSKRQEE